MSIRTLLFGYEMKNGKLYVLDEEAQIVRKIYMDYMSGRSLKSIATELTSMGVTYYLDKTVWSKNIISRILADPRYAGADSYPAIISQADFECASGRKSAMGGAQAEIPEMTAEVKSKMVCACCGQNINFSAMISIDSFPPWELKKIAYYLAAASFFCRTPASTSLSISCCMLLKAPRKPCGGMMMRTLDSGIGALPSSAG